MGACGARDLWGDCDGKLGGERLMGGVEVVGVYEVGD